MYRITLLSLFIFLFSSLFAQSGRVIELSLEDCWQRAEQQAAVTRQNELSLAEADLGIAAAKSEAGPQVNGQSRLGYQLGRSIDPTSNSFVEEGVLFNSAGVTGNWELYAGGLHRLNRQLATVTQGISRQEVEVRLSALRRQVFAAFATALESRDLLALQTEELNNRRKQLHELDRLIVAGVRKANDRFELELSLAQLVQDSAIAAGRAVLRERELAFEIGYFDGTSVRAQRPDFSDLADQHSGSQPVPTLNQASLAVLAARNQLATLKSKSEKTTARPRVSAFAQLSTNYSSAAQTLGGIESIMVTQPVLVGGQQTEIVSEQFRPNYVANPLLDQLGQNFSQVLGVQVDVPIFDAGRRKNRQQRIEIERAQNQLATRQERERLQKEYARLSSEFSVAAAARQLARQQVDLASQTFSQAQRAFRAGGLSATELNRINDQVQLAKLRLLKSEYDCYFNRLALQLWQE